MLMTSSLLAVNVSLILYVIFLQGNEQIPQDLFSSLHQQELQEFNEVALRMVIFAPNGVATTLI